MTEKEVLGKLDFFKQAIQKLKEERDYWKEQTEENPKEVCELDNLKEACEKLNKEHLDDTETIADLKTKCEEFCNNFNHADLECNRLRSEIERADAAYAKLAHMYNEKNNSDKKYTEEDEYISVDSWSKFWVDKISTEGDLDWIETVYLNNFGLKIY